MGNEAKVFIKKYLNRRLSIQYMESQDLGDLGKYFLFHQNGQLGEAFQLASKVKDNQSYRTSALYPFFESDLNLLRSKIGLDPVPLAETKGIEAIINDYAFFTFYFWVDVKLAFSCLHRMFSNSIKTGRLDFLLMVLFLIGHMRTIDNRKIFASGVAGFIYRLSIALRKRNKMSPTSHDIIVSTYPYTNYVRANLRKMEWALRTSKPFMPSDPYYGTLYQLTFLYNAAYSGRIIDTENTVRIFKKLQDEGKLVRYRPVTTLLSFLPMCSRGYEYLIKDEFQSFMKDFDESQYNILINSQAYRVASIISMALNDYNKAEIYIDKAIAFREKAAFESWAPFDKRVRHAIRNRLDMDVIFSKLGKPADSTNHLKSGYLMTRLIGELSHWDDIDEFTRETSELISQHLGLEGSIDVEPRDDDYILISLFSHNLYFVGPEDNLDKAKELLEVIIPSLRSVENTIGQLRDAQSRIREQEKLAAVAKTTQMLAHDVRRPFTMVKGLLDILEQSDQNDVPELINEFKPEIERSINSVNGMIEDVMEVGSKKPPAKAEVCLEALIDNSLKENIGFERQSKIEVSRDLDLKKLLHVDPLKVSRLFSNIVGNALEAMNYEGKLWFHSKEHNGQQEIVIGNSGSFIPKDELDQLFKVFYTKGKKEGTGLGLTIAEKVVKDHGGEIWCTSSQDRGTEFHIRLPNSGEALDKTHS